VNNNIIYSDRYTNLEQYFRAVMLKTDIYDARVIDSRLTSTQIYYHALQDLANQFEIVEFLPNEFINIRRLEQGGVTKEMLKDFINDMYEFEGDELFTISYLRKRGFEHKLDELGFDDWFYASLLRRDRRFKFRRFGRAVLFRKGNDIVTLDELVEHIVTRHRSIDTYDLIEFISQEYGIKVDPYSIPQMAKEKNLYYDKIMEKVYIDYDEYFEEV
jgi:hypothetical protein